MPARGWPAELVEGRVGVRPLRRRDATEWVELRRVNARWLAPWEATPPGVSPAQPPTRGTYLAMWRVLRTQARRGEALPFVVTVDDVLVGQVTVGNVVRGALNAAYVGYWLAESHAGRGIMPTALAMIVDHCFGPVGLHRIEANVRPENDASRRVVAKLGFREEGLRLRYLYIDGAYRDHICYALTVEDVPEGLLRRWRSTGGRRG